MSDFEAEIAFLTAANEAGYANEQTEIVRLPDGTHKIGFAEGDFYYEDSWWGGNPFAGQEYISRTDKVIWALQYRGWMEPGHESQGDETYRFLKKALRYSGPEDTIRGPKEFKADGYLYANSWGRNFANFRGEEKIWKEDTHIYTCIYFGGMVDL